MTYGRFFYGGLGTSDIVPADPGGGAGNDYGASLLTIFPTPKVVYALETGATSAERSGAGGGVLTYSGTPTYVGPAVVGAVAGGMSFNGTTQWGSATDHASHDIDTSDFWLHALINLGGSWVTGDDYLLCHNGDGGTGSWDFKLRESSPGIAVRIVDSLGTSAEFGMDLDGGVPASGWHQVVFTCDRDSATGGRLYFDGAQQADTGKNYTAVSGAVSSATTLYVARREAGTYLAGSLAWVGMGLGLPSGTDIANLWALRA